MIPALLLAPLRRVRNANRNKQAIRTIDARMAHHNASSYHDFDFLDFRQKVLEFVRSMQTAEGGVRYRYAGSVKQPTLYASAYACMTLSILGSLEDLPEATRRLWVRYFDGFQNDTDGLFYDPAVMNRQYRNSDWWGARHVTMHMISAYTDLCARPRYPFRHLEEFYEPTRMQAWLDGVDWSSTSLGTDDIDNKIMNIGCQLQFQRDMWHDDAATDALINLKTYLRDKINPNTGMWGCFDWNDPAQRSRMVQFAYHLFLIYFYDGDFDFDHTKIISHVLRTQNRYGGYGVKVNSSACEDIDSIDLLIRFSPHVSGKLRGEIDRSLRHAMDWVMLNQMGDGGFVFRLAEPFRFGSTRTSSQPNESAMLPTWFRTLSLAYLARFFDLKQSFRITTAPGCEI